MTLWRSVTLMKPGVKTVVALWLAWAVVMLAYPALATARFAPQRPDKALSWTAGETTLNSQKGKPYLVEPFLNTHVSWDSEFYLSIATHGYDDPFVRAIPRTFTWANPQFPCSEETIRNHECISLNYAFFPLYPWVIRLLGLPLRVLGLNLIATHTLAGVLVSMLGALAAMLALYDLAQGEQPTTGIRAAFYLIIFPGSMFLAQVYTEGLFVGLAFGALALLRRRQWVWAALLAAGATLTRAVGVALVLPFLWAWLSDRRAASAAPATSLPAWVTALVALAPVVTFGVWRLSWLGQAFHLVETLYFGRGALLLGPSLENWSGALFSLFGDNPQAAAYYAIEFGAIAVGLLACALAWREQRGLALFGLAVIGISWLSGPAQGMHRYVIAAAPLFLTLAKWGEHDAFDRAWTLTSVLLLGLLTTLFSFDFWTG